MKILKRISTFLLLSFLVLSTSSCIDLLHEIKIKKDKSGVAFIGIESNAIGMMASLATSYLDEETKLNLNRLPINVIDKLKGIKGITQLEALTQPAQGRFGVRFHFDNPAALNKAYYALGNKEKAFFYPDIVKISRHRVKVRNVEPFVKYYLEHEQPDLIKDNYIKYLNVRIDIEVEGNIKSESIKQGKLNASGNRISYRFPLEQVMGQKTPLGTRFRYSN